MSAPLWKVAVDAPLDEALTYSAPVELQNKLSPGVIVEVPLGRRTVRGVVLASTNNAGEHKLKDIISVVEEYSALPPHFLKWLEWVANYYFYPVGEVCSLALPPLEKAKKPSQKSRKGAVVPELAANEAPPHTEEQKAALNAIKSNWKFQAHLLFGVTGSGKTEVYLDLLDETLRRGQQGIVLVPEIALTPQLVNRFAARFGKNVAVIHSQLTEREKTNQWWSIKDGQTKILIGARSALFCPIDSLGIIIVDEEHDSSYKQEEKLKYNARDCAVMLGHFANCPVILGSATPSLESWLNAKEKKYQLHTMKERVQNRPLPNVDVVDLRNYRKQKRDGVVEVDPQSTFWLSPLLEEKLRERLERREQSVLFLNRRGVAQVVVCPICGANRQCPNCAVTLTLHAKSHLVCHYCDYHENLGRLCTVCKEAEMQPLGIGTEKIESDLALLFPNARIARADRDEVQSREAMEEIIAKMEMREIDILVGTQMISKGLDFESLTLVGLVLADVGFHLPDFRATERSFQLLTQVSGRAGRHQIPGEVVIQTYTPDHPSIEFAKQADYIHFSERELQLRRELNYPPYGKLASIRIQGIDAEKVSHASHNVTRRLHKIRMHFESLHEIEILGPAEAPLAKLRGKHRHHILLKARSHKTIAALLSKLLQDSELVPSAIQLSIDIDPVQML